ncbi:MAG TPA: hypothetical protein VJU87_03020 [Gemmatimonadaceae bacterium]|nr:hypothetical protein [Gemmatimonadaceae bacterium]
MKWARAVVAGIIGALAVVALFALARWVLGVNANVSTTLGSIVLPARYGALLGWIAGAIAQLILGAVAGIIYGLIFEYVTRRAGWLVGGLIGIAHALFAGVAIGFLPMRMAGGSPAAPGAFLEYRGAWAVVVLVVVHVIFGVLVGALYGATHHAASAPGVRWRELRSSDSAP